MNLGMLLAWEQVYLLKVKEDSIFTTENEMISHLKDTMHLDDTCFQMADWFYEFSREHFTEEQWSKVDELFQVLEDGRSSDVNGILASVGKVLWEMGGLFGTNYPNHEGLN